jgi:hypothetical protein
VVKKVVLHQTKILITEKMYFTLMKKFISVASNQKMMVIIVLSLILSQLFYRHEQLVQFFFVEKKKFVQKMNLVYLAQVLCASSVVHIVIKYSGHPM